MLFMRHIRVMLDNRQAVKIKLCIRANELYNNNNNNNNIFIVKITPIAFRIIFIFYYFS